MIFEPIVKLTSLLKKGWSFFHNLLFDFDSHVVAFPRTRNFAQQNLKQTEWFVLAALAYPACSLLILVFALPHRLKIPKTSPKLTQKSASNTKKQPINYEKK